MENMDGVGNFKVVNIAPRQFINRVTLGPCDGLKAPSWRSLLKLRNPKGLTREGEIVCHYYELLLIGEGFSAKRDCETSWMTARSL